MIHSFSASNFFSFKGVAEVPFQVGTSAPDTEQFFISDAGQRLSKVQVVIGPNGSGKTNLLKALPFLRYFMLSSFSRIAPEDRILVSAFSFSRETMPLCLCMEFEEGGRLYKYELELAHDPDSGLGVSREQLSKKYEKSYRYLFKRNYDGGSYKIALQDLSVSLKDIHTLGQRRNASLFSVLRHIGTPEITTISNGLQKMYTNVDYIGKVDSGHIGNLEKVAKLYAQKPDLKDFVESILSDLDLGLSGFEIKEYPSPDDDEQKSTTYYPVGIHTINGEIYPLRFAFESTGTKKLFVLLAKIAPVLFEGGIAIIDEFETDLHPHMIPRLLDLFFDPVSNPHNAQLLFSCHAMEILQRLDKTQINLVEKDSETCESEAYRLDQLKGVRRDDNFYAKYMSSVYGAVPNI